MNYLERMWVLVLLSILMTSVGAQEIKPEKAKGKVYRLTLFNMWEGPQLFAKKQGDFVPVSPARYSYTQYFKYKENRIELFEKITTTEGEEVYTPVVEITVPESIKEPLVVLAWDNGQKKARARTIEFSPEKFKYGSYQIVNFSNLPLGGYIGNKNNKVVCSPQGHHITSFSIKEQEATPIVFYTKMNDKIKKVFGSITIHRNKKRSVYFMYPENTNSGNIVYQTFVLVDHKRAE